MIVELERDFNMIVELRIRKDFREREKTPL